MNILLEALKELFTSTDIKILIKMAIIAFLGYLLFRLAKLCFKKLNKDNIIHIKFAKNLVYAIIIMYTLYWMGIQMPSTERFIKTILTSSSLLIVVAGFAAQEALSNVINGLFISIFKPFQLGDRIHIVNSNITGYVEDINLRHTVIRTLTNSRIIVPNNTINKDMIENSHFYDTRSSMFLDMEISYESDISKAKEIMADVIGNHPKYLDVRTEQDKLDGKPKVEVLTRELSEYSIILRANVWTNNLDDNFRACSDIRETLKTEFDKNGIEIPYRKLVVIK